MTNTDIVAILTVALVPALANSHPGLGTVIFGLVALLAFAQYVRRG